MGLEGFGDGGVDPWEIPLITPPATVPGFRGLGV